MSESKPEIFDSWSLYDRVLDRNVMFHEQIFRNVRAIVAEHFGDRGFSVLDLGCGSARHAAGALTGRRVTGYVGVDTSQAALDHARDNLASLGCPVRLDLGDLLDGLRGHEAPVDLILSSFAVHHLSTNDKASFFRHAAAKLTRDGMLLLIDAVRNEGESREAFLDDYLGWAESNWAGFSPDDLREISNHMRSCDFPETAAVLKEMAADTGLSLCHEATAYKWHHTFCFERGAESQ